MNRIVNLTNLPRRARPTSAETFFRSVDELSDGLLVAVLGTALA